MRKAIFLSASVPDARRSPRYAETADTVAITAAVTALVYVTLGRRQLVWGGHPAITPMIWAVADSLNVDYGRWVKLYQSRYFKDDFPEDNEKFCNVIYTDEVDRDRERSLLSMREQMLADYSFTAAVFIGGMDGIIQEFNLVQRLQPKTKVLPVVSSGGAVHDIANRMEGSARAVSPDLRDNLDYVALFHKHLRISVAEMRYPTPEEQPPTKAARIWHRNSER